MTTTYTTADIDATIDSAVVKLGFDGVKKNNKKTFVSGKDTFVCLPTGYGKSLCYSLLPIVYDLLWKKANQSIVLCMTLVAIVVDEAHCVKKW